MPDKLYVVGMSYMTGGFEPEMIFKTKEGAREWISNTMEGYQYSGLGVYAIREVTYCEK